MGKGLKKFLKKNMANIGLDNQLIVSDKLLGAAIKKKFKLNILFTDSTKEILRGVREQLSELITGLSEHGMYQFGNKFLIKTFLI
jgi:nucleolar protein 58